MSLPGISGKSLNPMSYSRASPESVIIRKNFPKPERLERPFEIYSRQSCTSSDE
ncbi:Uncharacterized protein dnm_032640 [Desulfonema magnum]|uniref:Uncharacterized protein n=1 Tax=Desulfonema magnum TaxID=45655 RepID=A0A975BLD7_9BACT|nr:Uncharacterized protein dnm_032640 [Desulfonema magnum]